MTLKDIKGLLYERFFFGYLVNDEIKNYLHVELEPPSYLFSKSNNLIGPYGKITHNISLDTIYYFFKENHIKPSCK